MRSLAYFLTVLTTCGCTYNGPTGNSTPSVEQVNAILKDDLRGIPLDEFETRLGINDAVYDEIYTNEPEHSRRLYHLGAFSIDVSVEHRDTKLYTDTHFFPGVGNDGLSRQQRMKAYEDSLAEHFAERQKRLDGEREKEEASARTGH